MNLVLGIDAGGTKTTAAIANVHSDDSIEVLSQHTTGPGNPKRIGPAVAYKNVLDAIDFVTRAAQASIPDIHSSVIGMAGAGTEAVQSAAIEFLAQSGLQRLNVVPDYHLVLPAAFPTGGVSVIAGTGSIAHGVNGDREARVGGHGYLIDDAGSGFWIGQQALRAVVRAFDGRGQSTALTTHICNTFGANNAQEIVAKLHSSQSQLEVIATIAPLVITAAPDDDVAHSILNAAAEQLCQLVSTACQKVGYKQGYSLAVAGSVLTKCDAVRTALETSLKEAGFEPKTVQAVLAPVDGAIQLAIAALRET